VRGGLATTKVKRMRVILQDVLDQGHHDGGEPSLEYLRDLPDEDVKRHLLSYKGVGAKTLACVMMFGLNRPEFPVDTHVHKVALRLQWVPPSATRLQTYEHLNRRVPESLKPSLHVLMIEHDKRCRVCGRASSMQRYPQGECPLMPFIASTHTH